MFFCSEPSAILTEYSIYNRINESPCSFSGTFLNLLGISLLHSIILMSKSYCNYTLLLLTHPVLDQKQSPEGALRKRCSCEFCEISKNIFSYRTPLVSASVKSTLTLNPFLPSFIFRPTVGRFICLPLNICIQFEV